MNAFDEDYFERGVETGRSLYSNYRWIPELTIPMAARMIEYLNIKSTDTILDFGCAKGFLVKALRLLGRKAFGYDTSEYAISRAPEDVREYLASDSWSPVVGDHFDWVVSKDVLEHIEKDDLNDILTGIRKMASFAFFAVPLGNGSTFTIPAYDHDATHKIRETPEWWSKQFTKAGFSSSLFSFDVPGMKENWSEIDDKGNGFFILEA